MFVDGSEKSQNYTYEDYKAGNIVITRGDYQEALNVMDKIFGLMIAVDTKRIYIYDNEKGYYKEITVDQLTGLYEKLTKESNATTTSDIFKKKIFRHFGESFTMKQDTITNLFVNSSKRYIPFRNGHFDLKHEIFIEHSKDIYFRSTMNASYSPEAECPTFKHFMDEFSSNDKLVQQTLLEFASYCLISGYHYGHNFLILNGNGRNGKSTFIRTIARIVGKNASSAMPMERFTGFDMADMAGKLLNHSEESGAKWVGGEQLANLKSITGGDSLPVNEKFKKPYTESNWPKLIFAMNEIPKFGESTVALRKRIICVECKLDLRGKEDASIEKRIDSEVDGIATMLVKHLLEVKKRKKLYIYPDNDQIVCGIDRDSSIYSRFFYDRINNLGFTSERRVLWQDEIWEALKEYAKSEDYNESMIHKSTLGRKMKHFLNHEQVRRVRNNGKLRWVYHGIEWHPEGDYNGQG